MKLTINCKNNEKVVSLLPDSLFVLVLGYLKRNNIKHSVEKTITEEKE